MAEFSVNLSQPQEAGATPVAPVQSVDYGRAISTIGNMAAGYIERAANLANEQNKNTAIGAFTEEIRAIEESGMGVSEKMARARATYSKYVGQFPSYGEEFKKQWTVFREGGIIGGVAEQEKRKQETLFKLDQEMVTNGWGFIADLPEDKRDQARDAYSQTIRSQKEMERSFKMNAELRAQAAEGRAMSAEQRNIYDFEQKQGAVAQLRNMVDGEFKGFQLSMESLVEKAKKNPQAWEEISLQIDQNLARIQAGAAQLGGANQGLVENYVAGFKTLADISKKMINPQTKAESLTNQWNAAVAQQKLTMFAKDQADMSVIATSSVLGYNAAGLIEHQETFVKRNMKDFLDPNGKPIDAFPSGKTGDTEKITKGLYDVVNAGLNQVMQGNGDVAKAKEETVAATNNILKSLPVYSDYINNPKELKQFTEFTASPQFAFAVKNGMVSAEFARRAAEVWQYKYQQPAIQAMVQTLNTPVVQETSTREGKREIPMTSLVDIGFEGNRVTVAPKANSTYMNQQEKEFVRSKQRDIEASGKVLTQLVMTGAHLAGTTDYKAYWEENKHKLVPGVFPDPKKLKPGQVVELNGKKYEFLGGTVQRDNFKPIEEEKP